jgi:hypothetical protein
MSNIQKILKEIIKGTEVDIPKQFSPEIRKEIRAMINAEKDPGAVSSTKSSEKEANKKKRNESLKELFTPRPTGIKKPELQRKPRRTLSDVLSNKANKPGGVEPVKAKKGGEIKKKSKKSGRLAKRGYGKSR